VQTFLKTGFHFVVMGYCVQMGECLKKNQFGIQAVKQLNVMGYEYFL
jgi:hypothetical protein